VRRKTSNATAHNDEFSDSDAETLSCLEAVFQTITASVMLRLRFLTVALLTPFVAHAQSSRWVPMNDTTQKPALWLDSKTIVREPSGYRAWVKRSGDSDTTALGKRYTVALTHYIVNCKTKQYGFLGTTYLDSQGNVVNTWTNSQNIYSLQDPIPESVGEYVVSSVCIMAPIVVSDSVP